MSRPSATQHIPNQDHNARARLPNLLDGGCKEGGLIDGGGPGVEQHLPDGCRHDREQFTPSLVWRDFFDTQRPADPIKFYFCYEHSCLHR
jgi:hypothetical protein